MYPFITQKKYKAEGKESIVLCDVFYSGYICNLISVSELQSLSDTHPG